MKSNKGQNINIIIFREIFPGVRLKCISVGLLTNVKMAAPERTGIISVACRIFRAFLMNSEDHANPERILPCIAEWCSLFGFRKYWTSFCFFCSFGHHLSAYPVGVRELPEKQVILLWSRDVIVWLPGRVLNSEQMTELSTLGENSPSLDSWDFFLIIQNIQVGLLLHKSLVK